MGNMKTQKTCRVAQENYRMLMTAVNGEGEKREELEKAWGDCGADMSAWQQNFTGNHTMKLLQEEAVNHYTSVFPPTDEILHVKAFLICLGKIAKLCLPRTMTDEEIAEMDALLVKKITS